MATKRLLVDAIHPEETRIVVTNGTRLEEFDFESATRRQLRGNIYLAKVTRVEPSLQAAFIEYGGNRHGFLAFSEIHPDYYQIPVADREALLRQEEAEDAEEERAEDATAAAAETTGAVEPSVSAPVEDSTAEHDSEPAAPGDDEAEDSPPRGRVEQAPAETEPVESVGSGDALEELRDRPRRSSPSRRSYKIQEVIKRRQVMLVQVVKEERGNKGAALTTYLSLAGRYSVLMPNTARGGGISRKITNAADRKRLKDIVGDLDIPPGQGIILRTAGASRTKAEVKRDFEYLQRLWENVRSLTLKSVAPCLVYEEGSLIKRTIRDLYSKDIEEMFVAGDDAYREAKDFMRMIMPSHAKNVQLYKDDQPVFSKYAVESQLDSMFSPQVTLPSGGYIVINPTEALVSIDVNSGRSTKEHNIEDTALQTNLEAAEEVARQLRLRDLAGLIVIDFIDMVENRSNRAVERKLKDCLKNDRARIQVGRISHFGLMEMSRQRIRFGVVESSTHKCPTCEGTGIVRSTESVALMVMRAVEDHVLRKPGNSINVKVPTDVALYILNGKRNTLSMLEAKYQLSVNIVADDHIPGAHYLIERGEARIATGDAPTPSHVRVDSAAMMDDAGLDIEEPADAETEADAEAEETPAREAAADESGDRQGRRGRRRRGGRGRDAEQPRQPAVVEAAAAADADGLDDSDAEDDIEGGEEQPREQSGAPRTDSDEPRKRRRRGRRGGRRNRRLENGEFAPAPTADGEPAPAAFEATTPDLPGLEPTPVAAVEQPAEVPVAPAVVSEVVSSLLTQDAIAESSAIEPPAAEEKPKRTRRRKVAEAPVEGAVETTAAPVDADAEAPAARPKPRGRRAAKAAPPTAEEAIASADTLAAVTAAAPAPELAAEPVAAPEPAPQAASVPEPEPIRRRKELPPDEIVVSSTSAQPATEEKPKRAGWWQRGFFGN